MTLSRWDPFGEMTSLRQAMDRLLEDAWVRPSRFFQGEGQQVPLDVAEDEHNYTVKVALPGIKPDEVDINVVGNVLTIRGEHKEEQEEEQQTWHRREIRYGRFERSVSLPTDVQADQADANFENGVLTLRLPKAEAAKPKRIQIKGSQQAIEGSTT